MSYKILFISFNNFNDLKYGGGQCSNRNYNALKKISQVETYQIQKKSTFKSGLSILKGFYPPTDQNDISNILSIIKQKSIDIVFFDGSLFGNILEEIKFKFENLKIITFFHNVELKYLDVRFGNKLRKHFYYLLAKDSEKKHLKYSDKTIALNKRDSKQIKNIYDGEIDYIIPITFKDKLNSNLNDIKTRKNTNKCLYVGALRRDTFEGIKWFSKNVVPYISGELDIVGKNFETKRNILEKEKVNVIGTVEKLDDYYFNSSCVVLPILSGAGMKVKTAEALMYGKTIFGTTEAFEGYDANFDKIGGICNGADEFINKINGLFNKSNNIFNIYSRKLYEDKYSTKASDEIFNQLINELK